MGNFGKRLLIILLAAVCFVALAVIGNAYQQAERIHKVSKSSEVVFEGQYGDKAYTLTKKDIWNNIIESNPTDSIVELLNLHLLQSVIETTNWTDEQKQAKLNSLVYSSTDSEYISKLQRAENKESNDKLWKSFFDSMKIMGYSEGVNEEEHTVDFTNSGKNSVNFYLEYALAMDEYAKYRLTEGLEVGGKTYTIDEEALKDELSKGYEDTYAIAIKFLSEKDATNVIASKDTELCIVDKEIRYYTGSVEKGKYVIDTLDDEWNVVYKTQVIGEETYKIPNASVATDEDGNYQTINLDELLENQGTTTYTANDYSAFITRDDELQTGVIFKSSNSTSSTIYAIKWNETSSVWQRAKLYTIENELDADGNNVKDEEGNNKTYNKFVAPTELSYSTVKSFTSYDDASFSTTNTTPLTQSLFLEVYINLYNFIYEKQGKQIKEIADIDLSTVTDEQLNSLEYVRIDGEIRKYVGNDEYVVELDDEGACKGEGYPTYKKTGLDKKNVEIPNYKIEMNEDGTVKLDKDNNFIYLLDEFGEKIPNDGKVEFKDQTSFTKANTVAITAQQEYSIYAQFSEDSELLKYVYDETNEKRADFAKELFETLDITSSTGAFLKNAMDLASTESEDNPHYLIYKLSSSKKVDEPTEEEINIKKEEKIKEYIEDKTFVQMCLAELRKEAGIKLYDKFFGYSYKTIVTYNSSSNKYGNEDTEAQEEYYSVKGYSASKLASMKAVDVMGTKVEKYTITTDDLYEYIMDHSYATRVSSAALNKVLTEVMPEVEQLHGDNDDYLTSKNWLMKQYADTVQYYNYQFESYKQMYAQYGYDYYKNVKEYLADFGLRSFDDLVLNLKRETMRKIFNYNGLVGNLETGSELTPYAKELLNNGEFVSLSHDFMDVYVNHLLFFVDLDEDGKYDDYKEFDQENNEWVLTDTVKNIEVDTEDAESYDALIDELYDKLVKYMDENTDLLSTMTSALSSFVKEYNNSSRIDGEYGKFKQYGIYCLTEGFEVNNSNINNYDKAFQEATLTLAEKLDRVDKDLLGYSVYDGLCESAFGLHYIIGSTSSTLPSFKFEADDNYSSLAQNDDDEISENQIILYMQEYTYSSIFGDSDSPEEKALESGYGTKENMFYYPNMPKELSSSIETIYGSYLNKLLDTENTYHSTFLMLEMLKDKDPRFSSLRDIYYSILFDENN